MATQPLADRMRPRTLDEFIGQRHIVGQGRLLRRAIEAATKVLARYGLKWKRPPQIHKFDHKVRICGFYVYPGGRVELRDKV